MSTIAYRCWAALQSDSYSSHRKYIYDGVRTHVQTHVCLDSVVHNLAIVRDENIGLRRLIGYVW